MARTGSARGVSALESTLDDAMRAPSTTVPDVVVIDFVHEEVKNREIPSPSKDLWVSSVDGRYQSPIIPVRCGPHAEIFPVHRGILTKSEYFRRALDGDFKEAEEQAIDLPEEDPNIFSFVVAFLYEGKFEPIKPIVSILVTEPDKGKGRQVDEDNTVSEDGTDSGSGSDNSARSRRRRRRRQERAWDYRQRKEPGRHRPECMCASCISETVGPSCWNCGVPRRPPQPRNRWPVPPGPPMPPGPPLPPGYRHPPRPPQRDRRPRGVPPPPPPPVEIFSEERMSKEDLRTWAMVYALSIQVYVCAERYLMQDFKICISASIINNFEIAGLDAAIPTVLESCKALHEGVSINDPLLKRVFARVGFLQWRLWKNFPEETRRFFMEDAELTTLIMKEMAERRQVDNCDLPAMERVGGNPGLGPRPPDFIVTGGRRPRALADD